MAFIYRAEKAPNIFQVSSNVVGPGEYLDNLPTSYSMIHNNINFKMYHATPDSLDKIFNPLFSYNQYTSYKDKIINDPNDMFKTDKEVILYGHTHQCFVGGFINSKFKLFMNQAILDSNSKVIINVGSSGEHNHMVCFNNIVETYIDSYLTYLILEDIDNIVFAHLKYVPYKETLKKVYLDILKKEKESLIPYSPKDKEKIYKSLRCMRQI